MISINWTTFFSLTSGSQAKRSWAQRTMSMLTLVTGRKPGELLSATLESYSSTLLAVARMGSGHVLASVQICSKPSKACKDGWHARFLFRS